MSTMSTLRWRLCWPTSFVWSTTSWASDFFTLSEADWYSRRLGELPTVAWGRCCRVIDEHVSLPWELVGGHCAKRFLLYVVAVLILLVAKYILFGRKSCPPRRAMMIKTNMCSVGNIYNFFWMQMACSCETMLIQINVCYIGSKDYFLHKQVILSVGRNVDRNEFLWHLFYGRNNRIECNNLHLSLKQSSCPREAKYSW